LWLALLDSCQAAQHECFATERTSTNLRRRPTGGQGANQAVIHVSENARKAELAVRPMNGRGNGWPGNRRPFTVIEASALSTNTLYISCFSASELAAMDTTTERIEHRVTVGTWPKAVDLSSDGRYVYTANYGGSSVSVVDTTDWTSTTLDVPAMDHASGIAAAHTGYRFYVTGWYDGNLFAIDAPGIGPGFALTPARRDLTLRRREYHRTHPAE
ncbi:MAG: beta-propeller fold lactonase family protein, partial [Deltaproteobacteria bacterium]